MLDYIGLGERWYGERRSGVHRRMNWEFQGILAGRAAPRVIGGKSPAVCGPTLWVSGPGSVHGWTSEPGQRCEVAVTHFDQVPDEIRSRVGGVERLVVPLSAQEADWLRTQVEAIVPDYRHPTTFSTLRIERLLVELSLLALRDVAESPVPRNEDFARTKVVAAKAWYSTHMEKRPSVAEVAEAVFVSPSHLRRIFTQAGSHPPHEVFRRMQINRVKQLMLTTELPLGEIAEMCGFSAQSDLSRVFRLSEGVAPTAWLAGRTERGTLIRRGC